MSRILTLKTLKSKNACREQVVLFRQLFGDSVVVTPELCVKHKNDFDFAWAAKNLLSKTAHDKYYAERNVAYDKYCAEENAAWNKYITEANATWNKYRAEANAAWNKYRAEANAAYDKYCAEKNVALDKYRAKIAPAFANAYTMIHTTS